MKKLLCALLAGIMLVGCGAKDSTPSDGEPSNLESSNPTGSDESVLPEGVSVKEAKYDSITIGGVNLSEFKIVYAADTMAKLKEENPGKYDVGDSAYAELTAKELSEVLENMTGIKVPVVPTTDEVGEHEILIGRTNRSESVKLMNAVDSQTYSIKMDGGKLCIGGGSSAANYHALDKLYEYFAGQNSKNVEILEDYADKGDAGVINISCIGDSITDGYGCTDWTNCPWPAVLQRIMWRDCVIMNFGVSGMTMRTDHRDAYINCGKYEPMIKAAPNADITLIMLGTNDSDRFKDWKQADTDQYTKDYTDMLDKLAELNPDGKFILMNCPEYFNGVGADGEFGSNTMVKLQKRLFEAYKEEGRPVSFFDMHSFTRKEMGKEMFPDGLHPGDEGYAVMAQRLADMLDAYLNDTEDDLLTK